MMKTIQLATACIFAAVTLFSLNTNAQQSRFSFGVKAGLNYSNANETVSYLNGKIGPKWGYQGGVTAEYRLCKAWYLQSGIDITAKGTKHKDAELWIGGENAPITTWVKTTNLVYAQLPLRVANKLPVASETAIYVNAGGYYAVGIAGKIVREEKTNRDNIPDNTTKFGSYSDNREGFSRPDAGVGFGIGAIYKKFSLGVDYELGLMNIGELKYSNSSTGGEYRSYKNYNFALVLGYRLK